MGTRQLHLPALALLTASFVVNAHAAVHPPHNTRAARAHTTGLAVVATPPALPPVAQLRPLLLHNFIQDEMANTHFSHVEHDEIGRNGKWEGYTATMFYVKGHPVRQITALDARQLSPQELAGQANAARQTATDDAKRDWAPFGVVKVSKEQIPFSQLANDYLYGTPSLRTWRGRPTWVLPMTPNPDNKSRSRAEDILLSSRGELWVDAQDLHVVRIQIHMFQPVRYLLGVLATVHAANLDMQLERYAPGVWVPQKVQFGANATIAFLKHWSESKQQDFWNYQPHAE